MATYLRSSLSVNDQMIADYGVFSAMATGLHASGF